MIQPFSKASPLHDRDRQTLRTPLSLLPHRPNTKPMADTMPREPARNKEPRKEPTNFVARFRFSGQISNRATFFLPKCVFPTYFIPPKPVFSALFCNYGGARCSTIPKKQPKNGIVRHLGTQNVPKRPEACNHRKKNASRQTPLFSIYFNALYQRGTKSPRNVTHLDEAGDVLLGYFNTIIYYAASEKLLWVRLFNLKNLYQQAAGNSSNTWNPAGDLRGPHPARLHPSRAIRHPSSTCT